MRCHVRRKAAIQISTETPVPPVIDDYILQPQARKSRQCMRGLWRRFVAKMTEKQLVARDAKRDLGAELLQAVREMKAGKGVRVATKVRKSPEGRNPHIGESFDYESARRTAKRRLPARDSADSKQHVTVRRRRQYTSKLKATTSVSFLRDALQRPRNPSMINERLRKRLKKDRPTTTITMRIPVDVVESLKAIAPTRSFTAYQTLLKSYISDGLRRDEAEIRATNSA